MNFSCLCACVCVALIEFASVAYMQCANTGVYKVNENRSQIHWHEDGIMDYDYLAGWQPPINMSDTFLDCLSTCQHTFICQAYLSAAMFPLACVSTLASPFLKLYCMCYCTSYVEIFTSALTHFFPLPSPATFFFYLLCFAAVYGNLMSLFIGSSAAYWD